MFYKLWQTQKTQQCLWYKLALISDDMHNLFIALSLLLLFQLFASITLIPPCILCRLPLTTVVVFMYIHKHAHT